MRVNVSGMMPTHPLALARQMSARSALGTYYTASPAFRTPRVPREKTQRHLALLPVIYVTMKRWMAAYQDLIYWHVNCEFDRWMASRLTQCDVQHVLSGVGLQTLRTAKVRFGALGVCDATTAHIDFSSKLMSEEAKVWSVPYQPLDHRFSERIRSEYEEAELLTVPSTFAMRTFIESDISRDKLALTPYGADVSDYSPRAKRDDAFRILFVGTVSIRKGVGYLLKALNLVHLHNAELAIRGSHTSEADVLFRKIPTQIPIRRIPPQPHTEMAAMFSQASVVVLPSIDDAFGLVVGQAMACGVPVIASTNTGGPDLIDDGVDGFIVPIRDPQAIADRIQQLHDDPALRDRMAAAARQKVSAIHGWDQYGAAAFGAYETALRNGRRG